MKVRRVVQDKSGTDNKRSDIIFDTFSASSVWETFEDTLVVSDGERNLVLIFLVGGPGKLWVDNVVFKEVRE